MFNFKEHEEIRGRTLIKNKVLKGHRTLIFVLFAEMYIIFLILHTYFVAVIWKENGLRKHFKLC